MGQPARPPSGAIIAIAAVSVLVALGSILVVVLWPKPAVEPAKAAPRTETEAPAPSPAPELGAPDVPPIELPPLDESDALVRRLVSELSSRPELAEWLLTEGLVRRITAAVDNVAEGRSPKVHVKHLRPTVPFAVAEDGEGFVMADAASRYATHLAVFTSLDPDGTARLYAQTKPLFQEAYRDLGYPQGNFDAALSRAIGHLLATPVPMDEPRLILRGTYSFADPDLERLSPAQKHLLRLGADGARQAQAHLRAIADALGVARRR
jgi:hypothetical protein